MTMSKIMEMATLLKVNYYYSVFEYCCINDNIIKYKVIGNLGIFSTNNYEYHNTFKLCKIIKGMIISICCLGRIVKCCSAVSKLFIQLIIIL